MTSYAYAKHHGGILLVQIEVKLSRKQEQVQYSSSMGHSLTIFMGPNHTLIKPLSTIGFNLKKN